MRLSCNLGPYCITKGKCSDKHVHLNSFVFTAAAIGINMEDSKTRDMVQAVHASLRSNLMQI